MDLKKLEELIRMLEDSSLSEIEIEEEGHRIRLVKPQPPAPVAVAAPVAIPVAAAPAGHVSAIPVPGAAPVPAEPEGEQLPTIDSPMVGTFYTASSPGEEPFVREGSKVDENQTVCIVEAMKLMNEVGAKFACVIEKVLVENGEPVEFGQPLFSVRPLG